jgi:hypothetical protein
MNQKKARPLAEEWLAGDKSDRTRIQQSLKGSAALQALLEAVGDLLQERRS